MKQGERASKDGYEVCLFPMDIVNITQSSGPGSDSHCCGHAIDIVGTTYIAPVYAPFSCKLTSTVNDGNTRIYTSNNKVWTPSGLTYVTIQITHDNSPPSKTSFTQGELIAHTGTAGWVTGDHCHLDQADIANSTLISYGVICKAGRVCYALRNSQNANSIYYLSGSERVINTKGLRFSTWDGSVHTGGKQIFTPGRVWWLRRLGEL